MSQLDSFTIENDLIEYAENILFGRSGVFDDERLEFIRDFRTIDLHAVPGSGKTTSILAKILILEKLQREGLSIGFCVISHTNAAIDEFKNRIAKISPKAFEYPNFIGTIQSFINSYLARPFLQYLNPDLKNFTTDDVLYNRAIERLTRNNFKFNSYLERNHCEASELRCSVDNDVTVGVDGRVLLKASGKSESHTFFTDVRNRIHQKGYLCYDDAYVYAEKFIKELACGREIIKSRFPIVLVDEMQDMSKAQLDILEKLFGKDHDCYQRIGDNNQAIYDSVDWCGDSRNVILNLNNSHRLSRPIAAASSCFAARPQAGMPINGLNSGELLPHVIVYDDENIEQVIPYFSTLIRKYLDEGKIRNEAGNLYKAIAWVSTIHGDSKRTLPSYWPGVIEQELPPGQDCLSAQLSRISDFGVQNLHKAVVNSILEVENIESRFDGMVKSEKQYKAALKEISEEQLQRFNTLKRDVILSLLNRNSAEAIRHIYDYFDFVHPGSSGKVAFLSKAPEPVTLKTHQPSYFGNGLEILIDTVHSSKGQTHTATLYMESFYHNDGGGGISYESQRLAKQFAGNPFSSSKTRSIESARMCYVGFTRPTDFLCFAVSRTNYETQLKSNISKLWEVIDHWSLP